MYSSPDLNFDPRFEDPKALAALSRRGFLGRFLGGALAGTALASLGAKTAHAAVDMNDTGAAAAPDDEPFWELVTKQFLVRPDLAYMNTGTRGPSPRSVHMAQIDALNRINNDYVSFRRDFYTEEYSDGFMAKFAEFVGCKPNELALANNTTDGMITGTFGPVLEPGDEILYGVTRQAVLELAEQRMPVERRPLPLEELLRADEVFITSSSKEVCPVRQVDDTTIGPPGPHTRALMRDFREMAAAWARGG
jgi:hypothetical protein